MKIMDKKENYDKMLKNNRVEKKTDGVESDRELRTALLISVFLSLSIILQIAESFIFMNIALYNIRRKITKIYYHFFKEKSSLFHFSTVKNF